MAGGVSGDSGVCGQAVHSVLAELASEAATFEILTGWIDAVLGAVLGDVAPESLARCGARPGLLARLHGSLEELRDALGDERFTERTDEVMRLLSLIWTLEQSGIDACEPPG